MSLFVTSVIPIELFTIRRRTDCIDKLKQQGFIVESKKSQLQRFTTELGGKGCEVYEIANNDENQLCIVAQDSGVCLLVNQPEKEFHLSEGGIRKELTDRNKWHLSAIEEHNENIVHQALQEIRAAVSGEHFGSPRINYVFSFYTITPDSGTNNLDDNLLKLLAEPSLLDIDDMLSTECGACACSNTTVKQSFLDEIEDCDLAHSSKTFITWATIVSFSKDADAMRTRALLAALECRLQLMWNRCYSVSEFIDSVFQEKSSPKDISELYWSFVRALDDAKAVISSTFSTRANRFFAEMVRTSRANDELERMSRKIELLEKYIEQRNNRRNKIYQKSIELLLFITALASLAQVLFPLPLNGISESSGFIIVGTVAIIGSLAIFKIK